MELLAVCTEALVGLAVVLASLRLTAALAGPDAWQGRPRITGVPRSTPPLGPDDDPTFLRELGHRLGRGDFAA